MYASELDALREELAQGYTREEVAEVRAEIQAALARVRTQLGDSEAKCRALEEQDKILRDSWQEEFQGLEAANHDLREHIERIHTNERTLERENDGLWREMLEIRQEKEGLRQEKENLRQENYELRGKVSASTEVTTILPCVILCSADLCYALALWCMPFSLEGKHVSSYTHNHTRTHRHPSSLAGASYGAV
jgi:predicted RNase H-like nuclease (RuvC/YqgF family)